MMSHQLSADAFQGFCEREGVTDQYALLKNLCINASQSQLTTMQQLESELTRLLLDRV